MTFYSYRSDGTVTKFNSDGNIESSYTVSQDTCTCPAGHRHTCRHRQMLPDLLPIADTEWFLDWDNGRQVVDFNGTPQFYTDAMLTGLQEEQILMGFHQPNLIEQTVEPASEPAINQPASWRRI